MTDRFPDAVLIKAIEAYESFDDYRSVTAMRAVLEAHLAETDRCFVCDALLKNCECEASKWSPR